jgi:acetolactate synthase-1/2/3 large subunit
VRYGVKIVVVVFRNGLHGTIAMHQARTMERLSGVSIGPVDAAGFARSLGAHSMTVGTEQELRPALRAALADPVTCVVDVTVDPRLIHPDAELAGV